MRYLFMAALVAAFLFQAGPARADDLRWTMELTLGHAGTTVANADTKRTVGLLAISGKADMGGDSADVAVHVLVDYTNGSGPYQLYMTMTFADGSVLTTYGSGLTQADAQGLNSRFQGPLTVVDGTGRFEGAHGGGTMAGQRAQSVGDDVKIRYEVALDLRK